MGRPRQRTWNDATKEVVVVSGFSRRLHEASAVVSRRERTDSFFPVFRSKERVPHRDGPRERRETAGRGEGGRRGGRPDGATLHYYTTTTTSILEEKEERYVHTGSAVVVVPMKGREKVGWNVPSKVYKTHRDYATDEGTNRTPGPSRTLCGRSSTPTTSRG